MFRILPMFHAAGWTFPWAITFSFATQVTDLRLSQNIDSFDEDHSADCRQWSNMETFPEFWSNALLWCANSSGMSFINMTHNS